MIRLLIPLVALLWASLLLISWNAPAETPGENSPQVTQSQSVRD